MAVITYKVTSTYPPGLTHHPLGGKQIIAGTIHKVEVGNTTIASNTRLPEWTSTEQLVWVRPEPVYVKPSTRMVMGSKGQQYVVTTMPTGRQTCTCPGYTFRRNCKHLGV